MEPAIFSGNPPPPLRGFAAAAAAALNPKIFAQLDADWRPFFFDRTPGRRRHRAAIWGGGPLLPFFFGGSDQRRGGGGGEKFDFVKNIRAPGSRRRGEIFFLENISRAIFGGGCLARERVEGVEIMVRSFDIFWRVILVNYF